LAESPAFSGAGEADGGGWSAEAGGDRQAALDWCPLGFAGDAQPARGQRLGRADVRRHDALRVNHAVERDGDETSGTEAVPECALMRIDPRHTVMDHAMIVERCQLQRIVKLGPRAMGVD
jgi:hypothetical protein